MSEFHSTLSRRDFMKGLGLAGAGIGLAAAPVFHDLDEVLSSPDAKWKRPWWVKSVTEPTVEIDWSKVSRFDMTKKPTTARIRWPENRKQHLSDIMLDWVHKNTNPNWKIDGWTERGGYPGTTRDMALEYASGYGSFNTNPFPSKFLGWDKDSKSFTPEQVGYPKWQGTPEESLQMMRVANRYFGGMDIGVVPLDQNSQKLFYANGVAFENVDMPYEVTGKKVIPVSANSQFRHFMVWTSQQCRQLTSHSPSSLGAAALSMSYSRYYLIRSYLQEFLLGLGFQGLDVGSVSHSNPFGVLAGHGENTRTSTIMTSPEHGNMIRAMDRILTNLPLPPTQPIDAGIRKFCYTCKKCAEMCPFGALNLETEPSWERPTNEYPSGWKGWVWDASICPWCCMCMNTCVFTKQSDSAIHDIIKGVVATTPALDGFFKNMDGIFGYGQKDPESWWDADYQKMTQFCIDPINL